MLDFKQIIIDSIDVKTKILQNCVNDIESASEMLIKAVKQGNKILWCGNGGSAADAQHMAAEFVGRYLIERDSLPAIALTTDTSALTGIGNDYGFEKVFARQCDALVNNGDLVIAISTSGKSPNIIEGIKTSKNKNAKIILLTGKNNNKLKHLTDITIRVPSNETPRIQESHRIIIHIICEFVEKHFLKKI